MRDESDVEARLRYRRLMLLEALRDLCCTAAQASRAMQEFVHALDPDAAPPG